MKKKNYIFGIIIGGIAAYFLGRTAISYLNSFYIENIIDDLPKNPNRTYSTRSINNIDTIIVHHSAISSSSSSANPLGYANYHINTRNYPAIAYHFVIQPDGKVYQTNKYETLSWHGGNINSRSVGVVVTGNFENEQFTDTQKTSLINTIKHIQETLGKRMKVQGHYLHMPTACPGTNIKSVIPQIINQSGALS